jgi:hypothetical protein
MSPRPRYRAGSTPLPAKSSELLLSPRMVAVNSHRIGSGRDCSEPIARLRDPGGSGHSVAQLLCGLCSRLLCGRNHDVLARIVSKCRCAKREREHDACASDRPVAHATWSASSFHALIVIRLRTSCKLIRRRFKTKFRHFQPQCCCPSTINPSKGNAPSEDW